MLLSTPSQTPPRLCFPAIWDDAIGPSPLPFPFRASAASLFRTVSFGSNSCVSACLPSVVGIEVYFFGGECRLVYFSGVVVDDSHLQFFPALLQLLDGLLAVLGLQGCFFLDHVALGELVLFPVDEVSAELRLWARRRQLLPTGAVLQLGLGLHGWRFKFGSYCYIKQKAKS